MKFAKVGARLLGSTDELAKGAKWLRTSLGPFERGLPGTPPGRMTGSKRAALGAMADTFLAGFKGHNRGNRMK